MDRRAFTAYDYGDIFRHLGYTDITITVLRPYVLYDYEWLNWDKMHRYRYDSSEFCAWQNGQPILRGGIRETKDCRLVPSFAIRAETNPKMLFQFVKEIFKKTEWRKWTAYIGKDDVVAQKFAKHFNFVQKDAKIEDRLLTYERL